MIYWLTGQPGSGKTTIAKALLKRKELSDAFLIDGDMVRELFNNTDYSEKGRMENIKLIQNIAKYLNSCNKDVIVSMVSPYRNQRELFKEELNQDITEIYVHTTEIRGKENYFVEHYEKPLINFIDIDTTDKSIDDTVNDILK